jgi:trans-aconitate methyltransferase
VGRTDWILYSQQRHIANLLHDDTIVKKIGDLVCGFARRILVLPVSRKALDNILSNAALKEVPENRRLFEILADDQSHGCYLRVDVIEGLSFATHGNIVQKAGQVVDEFAVDIK